MNSDLAPNMRTASTDRVVVTGITGTVGRVLAERLVDARAEVHGLVRRQPNSSDLWTKDVTIHQIDHATENIARFLEEIRPDTVIHLAALARRNHLLTDVIPFIESNVLFGVQLLEAMRLSGCRRFITAESVLQFSETGGYCAYNLYAATKQAFADLLLYYAETFRISSVALVLPTIYSEHEKAPKLMTDTASALLNGTVLQVQMENALVDFVHVNDVANAFVQAAALLQEEAVRQGGSVSRYWVSSGRNVTPIELVSIFERIGQKKITVQRRSSEVSRRGRPWHGPSLPGWTPQIDLEKGIERMLSTQS